MGNYREKMGIFHFNYRQSPSGFAVNKENYMILHCKSLFDFVYYIQFYNIRFQILLKFKGKYFFLFIKNKSKSHKRSAGEKSKPDSPDRQS